MSRTIAGISCAWLLCAFIGGLGLPSVWAEYQAKGKRDPFVALLTEDGQRMHPPGFDEEVGGGIEGLTLQGIVFDPHAESYAVLNGKVVREKEEIDGMKILKIEPDAVVLWVEGQSHRLTLIHSKEEKETP
ncbi:MAG: general secretion pathway protein GspB [Candidatus Omnitrophica bacterium]|nr:general secretion pathway protein GspB [Candidatus Omnitrophota bacterium]